MKKQETAVNAAPKTPKLETVKTVLIAILITGIISFIGGAVYGNKVQSGVFQKAQALTQPVEVRVSVPEASQGK